MYNSIDVSEHQRIINWLVVKPQIDFAIVRCGYGDDDKSQDDKYWTRNIEECIRLGIPVQVYFYTHATCEAQIKSEIAHTKRLLTPYKKYIKMLWLDIEAKVLSCPEVVSLAKVYLQAMMNEGYKVGVYASAGVLNSTLKELRNNYPVWVAQYPNDCVTPDEDYEGKGYWMWQYRSDGRMNGISGNVDMNHVYKLSGYISVVPKEPATGPEDKEESIVLSTRVHVNNQSGYLPWITSKDLSEFAGRNSLDKALDGIKMECSKGDINYRVHLKESNEWLPWVTNYYDGSPSREEVYAGIYGQEIDGIQMATANLPGYTVMYQAFADGRWLPWVRSIEDYAGLYGYSIRAVRAYIIKA